MITLLNNSNISNISNDNNIIDNKYTETYSSGLSNYIEEDIIDNISYTKFYTEVNTELNVGDCVNILNGNYDNYDNRYYNIGYKILKIDNTSITLDILYNGDKPYNEDDFNYYTKVYVVDTLEKFYYINEINRFGRTKNAGFKFSDNDNNIFISLLENLPLVITNPLQTKNKFYKSKLYNSSTTYNEDYYYEIDIDNGEIPLNINLYKNNRLYIIDSFEYDGIYYEKDKIYKWDSLDKLWVEDITYKKAYITKSRFIDGYFSDNSIFQDGIFGNIYNKSIWDSNAVWNNGIFYNSIWRSGVINSKSDLFLKKNYYSSIDNESGNISLTTDYSNNNGYGYNYFIDSILEKGTIYNCNIINSLLGTNETDRLLFNYYQNSSITFSDINIIKSYIKDSVIDSIEIGNSKIENSDINRSKILTGSKIINSQLYDSIVNGGNVKNKGSIKVNGISKTYSIKNDLNGSYIIHTYKFYINDSDFNKIEYNDVINFNNIDFDDNNSFVLDNIFNKNFYIIGGDDTNGFYNDLYTDLNKIVISSPTDINYENIVTKILIDKKTKIENKFKEYLNFNGSILDGIIIETNIDQSSIDLSIIVDYIPHLSPPDLYFNSMKNNYLPDIIFNGNEYISINNNKMLLMTNGEWIDGNIITDNQLLVEVDNNLPVVITYSGVKCLKIELDDSNYKIRTENILEEKDIINISNIWDYNTRSIYIGGIFEIIYLDEISTKTTIIVKPITNIITLSDGEFITSILNKNISLNKNIITGNLNELFLIRDGFFKYQSFDNTIIGTNKTKKLNIIKSEISSINNNIINNGNFLYGYFTSVNSNINNLNNFRSYKQIFKGANIKYAILEKCAIIDSIFENGEINNSKYRSNDDLLLLNNESLGIDNYSILPVWIDSTFNGGTFSNSIWMSGEFNNGLFRSGDFLSGNFNNGDFGDINLSYTSTIFRKGIWYNGNFNNGVFSDNILRIDEIDRIYYVSDYLPITSIYTKEGTNIWYNGIFNNGIFTSINGYVSLWYNGNFNNGNILDGVIWYDGVFNNGKFKSSYGRYISNIIGKYDIESISNDSNDVIGSDEYGSRCVNFNDYYTTSLSFITKDNITSIRNIHKSKKIIYPGTLILDESDNLVKYIFLSESFDHISDIDHDEKNSVGYSEKFIDDFFNSPTDIGIQFKRMDYMSFDDNKKNPLYNSYMIGSMIYNINDSNEYIYDGISFILKSNFISSNIPNTTETYENLYAWRGGVFNNGEFGDSNNINNTNPSWSSGIFNGGKFYGKVWNDGIFIKGKFYGSGVEQKQDNLTNIYDGYNPQLTIEEYINDVNILNISTYSIDQYNYGNIIDNYDWYGLWRNGQVLSNINEVSNLSDIILDNLSIEHFRKDKFNKKINVESEFTNIVWVNGIWDNVNAIFNESVWLSGVFKRGIFKNSLFNPYVQRWDFNNMGYQNLSFSFELNNNLCVWENGVFENGVFYYSIWKNGVFENGSMIGGIFKNGIANYISAYSTIWEDGRFRNGNWYGSNFTIKNVYNVNSIPNPFNYLGKYFDNATYPPFITDILSNNSLRLQDDRLHVWNMISGSQSVSIFDLSGHNFSNDSYIDDYSYSTLDLFGNPYDVIRRVTTELKDVTTVFIDGIIDLELKVTVDGDIDHYIFDLMLSDGVKLLSNTAYNITFYTDSSNNLWNKIQKFNNSEFTLIADIYDTLNDSWEYDVILHNIIDDNTTNYSRLETISFNIPSNKEYTLRLKLVGDGDSSLSIFGVGGVGGGFNNNFIEHIYLYVESVFSEAKYTTGNNTLNGVISPLFNSDYLNSEFILSNNNIDYLNNIGNTESCVYNNIDIATISIPTNFTDVDGAYAQYGNGVFLKGIWENGVWNNGYRGTDFGYFIYDPNLSTSDNIRTYVQTFANGSTSSVYLNPLYNNIDLPQHRTTPLIYFNRILRSYKTDYNKWEFILESVFNIKSKNINNISDYNTLDIGDKITISNIIAIDINGNRKLIKDLFTVISIDEHKIILEYTETFPISDIQVDSDRHLIYVHKNVWLYGTFLNGYYKGIMNNSYIKGNRETTKIVDTHLIDVTFDGGRLVGSKYDISYIFDDKYNNVYTMNPHYYHKYNDQCHSTLVQNMIFNDSVTLEYFDLISPTNVEIVGSSSIMSKVIRVNGTYSTYNRIKYLYNSDIDVVYEPEYFSSVYDQNIFNNCVLNESRLGDFPTIINNIPAGYITYDILSSISNFTYNTKPDEISKKEFELRLGSKYKKYNTLNKVDYSDFPNDDLLIDIPSTFNIVDSSTYGIYDKKFSGDTGNGVNYNDPISVQLHENFMYVISTQSDNKNSLITSKSDFKIKNRYHIVEIEVEFTNDKTIINPFDINDSFTLSTSYNYSDTQLPKLSIGQSYNELYETSGSGSLLDLGRLSPYDNDFISYLDGRKQSEINSFTHSNKIILKSFMYNNYGGYRDNVKLFKKDFDLDIGSTSSGGGFISKSPIYYSFKHYEIDKIPFFRYQDFIDPLTGTISEWNVISDGVSNQDQTRSVDTRIKIPYYATSVPIIYNNDSFILSGKINFFGGTNISNNNVIGLDVFNQLNG